MPPDSESDYEVGYGKPPRETRFAKGQSGNPRGRPSGAEELRDAAEGGAERAGDRHRERRASQGQQTPSNRHPARQPLGHRRLSRDQDPSRHRAGHRTSDRAAALHDPVEALREFVLAVAFAPVGLDQPAAASDATLTPDGEPRIWLRVR